MSKILDVTLSMEVAKRIKSKATKCFDNAYKAALLIEESVYVQGFLVFASAPCEMVEYGWLELGDRIIDPTFPHLDRHIETLYYFPAQRLTVPQLKATIEESKEDYPEDDPLPVYGEAPYEYYGDVMLGGADYAAAFKDAEAKCREIEQTGEWGVGSGESG
ncbi:MULTISPECIES: hypothetical protein [Chroococcidiopsis]|jgi:hypothetical protein|uniref:Uncharacterized protein n=3 Tax=Chroococcidiopsis TaxID=54298 RepID=K9U0B3_CHRTP|nr:MULTISPECIES: hypothetical protein [Chroococcidiopsis]AFY88527.1 hypothetical protein Chro_3060 [Chroococcidiopsis thermalis PCC 7203]URD47839.1 hypothetical protein M5J74_15990 [Chroococcidiopsis sp. CCNUC1]